MAGRQVASGGACPDMHGGDATGQVEDPDIDETGLFHHHLECFAIGKLEDGIGQVLVGAALGDEAPQPGQNAADFRGDDAIEMTCAGQ